MKVYCTKYALTSGIKMVDVHPIGKSGVVGYRTGNAMVYLHGEGKEWHLTWDSAWTRAEDMRAAKIVSLLKQVQRLEALSFIVAKETE